jgi:hypothetical protein
MRCFIRPARHRQQSVGEEEEEEEEVTWSLGRLAGKAVEGRLFRSGDLAVAQRGPERLGKRNYLAGLESTCPKTPGSRVEDRWRPCVIK